MSDNIRRNFMVSDELSKAINKLADNSNISKSAFVEKAIRYYIDNKGRDYKGVYEVINTMFSHIESKIDEVTLSIDKNTTATNDIKKDSNILVQCWNDTLLNNNDKDIILTDEKLSEGIYKAKNKYDNDLSIKRKKKLDKQ